MCLLATISILENNYPTSIITFIFSFFNFLSVGVANYKLYFLKNNSFAFIIVLRIKKAISKNDHPL